jgi:hypothetical protein
LSESPSNVPLEPPSGRPSAGGYPAPGAPLQYAAQPTNVLAVVSLITGICGLTVIPFLGALAAVISGHVSLSQIARTGENGGALAKIGLWLGYVGLVLWVAIFVLLFAWAGHVVSVTPSAPLSVG